MAMIGKLYTAKTTIIPSLPPSTDLSTKTILVTGATSGLGFECARQLLQARAGRFILPARTLSKGEETRKQLLNDPIILSKNPNATIEVYQLEMEDFDSVVAFIAALEKAGVERIDIAIMNAGVRKSQKTISKSGHEVTTQVNHLSTSLLTFLLLPYLRNASKLPGSSPARLTIVSSGFHNRASLSKEQQQPNIFTALDSVAEKKYDPGSYYNISKFLNVAWTRDLASRVSTDEVIINTVNPGACVTDLGREANPTAVAIFKFAAGIIARTAEQGARTYGHAAILMGKESHGQYINNCTIAE